MDIFLSINNREQVIQLPIIPEEFQVEFSNNNETFTTISQGDLNLIGNKGLKTLTIETFFPNKEYEFAKSKKMTGDEFVESILNWIDRKVPIRIVITSKEGKEVINLPVTIDSFNYGYDRVGDVKYSLALREFRFVGV
ncbi:phage portal protein (plasmid) [Crassaminicella thermophila]|uniref:Phage portal protein n=1 Tax=Crassaminicella thermophila TaxID=2599308 RepID=A0A5C0SLH1_CRATE|nr:phage portal protein [Crassaminicella thermophila]QEK13729.1 phage portal protein [Crassaminicella thermophila]